MGRAPPDNDALDKDQDLQRMELALLESGGIRIELQLQARRALQAAGLPITRAAVTRGAYDLLAKRDNASGAA